VVGADCKHIGPVKLERLYAGGQRQPLRCRKRDGIICSGHDRRLSRLRNVGHIQLRILVCAPVLMNGSVTPKPLTDGNQPIRICAESIYLQRYVKSSLNSPSAHYCTEKPGDAPNSTISPDKWSCSYRAADDGAALCSRFHMVAAREIAGDVSGLMASWPTSSGTRRRKL
jgi:hypothetical protein